MMNVHDEDDNETKLSDVLIDEWRGMTHELLLELRTLGL